MSRKGFYVAGVSPITEDECKIDAKKREGRKYEIESEGMGMRLGDNQQYLMKKVKPVALKDVTIVENYNVFTKYNHR